MKQVVLKVSKVSIVFDFRTVVVYLIGGTSHECKVSLNFSNILSLLVSIDCQVKHKRQMLNKDKCLNLMNFS